MAQSLSSSLLVREESLAKQAYRHCMPSIRSKSYWNLRKSRLQYRSNRHHKEYTRRSLGGLYGECKNLRIEAPLNCNHMGRHRLVLVRRTPHFLDT